MKISILGYSGSGKSTFAKKLSDNFLIEVTYLDKLHFNPNWEIVDKDLFESRIQEVLRLDKWIIEGNYSKFGTNRITDSNLIFIFNFNRFRCLYNLVKRRIKYHNKVRESAADGCIEKIDLAFLKFVMITARNKGRRNYYKALKNNQLNNVIIFKNHRQVNKYIKSLSK